MTWEVEATEQVKAWMWQLDQPTKEALISALGLLREFGPNLGRPYVGKIVGSKLKNLKELRPTSNGFSHQRVLFAFDTNRRAILLVAGNKAGQWKKWYKIHIPLAEELFQTHLEEK